MEHGKMSALYDAYLASFAAAHPNLVEPVIIGGHDKTDDLDRALWKAGDGKPEYTRDDNVWRKGKVWGRYRSVFQAEDGRVIEYTPHGRCNFNIYAVFPNWEAFNSYEKPRSFNEYFDQW